MRVLEFESCLVIVSYDQGWTLTVYEDGKTLKSQSFGDTTAQEFGYEAAEGRRLSCDHDLLHHWLGARLGSGSINHWIVAHNGDEATSEAIRAREERLVTGVMMLMRLDKVPERNSWTEVPNESVYYTGFAQEVLGSEVGMIANEAKKFLAGIFENTNKNGMSPQAG